MNYLSVQTKNFDKFTEAGIKKPDGLIASGDLRHVDTFRLFFTGTMSAGSIEIEYKTSAIATPTTVTLSDLSDYSLAVTDEVEFVVRTSSDFVGEIKCSGDLKKKDNVVLYENYQGVWDATTNTLPSASGSMGYWYINSAEGTTAITIDSLTSIDYKDIIISNGEEWQIISAESTDAYVTYTATENIDLVDTFNVINSADAVNDGDLVNFGQYKKAKPIDLYFTTDASKGDPLKIVPGATDGVIRVAKAAAGDEVSFVAFSDYNAMDTGYGITKGLLEGVDTSGASVVDQTVYRGTDGFTLIKPQTEYQIVGKVVEIGTNGSLFVSIGQTITFSTAKENELNYLYNGVKPFTGIKDVDTLINELRLFGLDDNTDYYIGQISVRNTPLLIFTVFDESNTKVCQLFSGTKTATDTGVYWLEEYNGSGVTGFVKFNTSTYYDIAPDTHILNKDYITTDDDRSMSLFDYDFMDRDITIRRNKLNPHNIIEKKKYSKLYYTSGSILAAIDDSDFFNIYDIIPIKNNESITISNTGLFQCKLYIINKYRQILKETSIVDVRYDYTEINDTGEDAYIAVELRRDDSVRYDGIYPQIEYNTVYTKYEKYRKDLLIEELTEIVLPSKLYSLTNRKYNIYKQNIISANPYKYNDVVADDDADTTQIIYPRQIHGEPSSTAEDDFTITLLDGKSCVSALTIKHTILDSVANGTINIFTLGDSFTDIGQWLEAISENMDNDSITCNFIGLKNKEGFYNESQTGGTLENSFLIDRGDAFVLGVTGFTNDGTADGYNPAQYYDGSNYFYFDGRKVDENGDGVIRVIPKVVGTVPVTNGTLTRISGGSYNYPTINYTTVDTVNRNPLWNPLTDEVDISYYMDYYGFSTDYDLINDKTVFILQFSWNDIQKLWYDVDNIEDVVAQYVSIIDLMHTQYPNAYVVIGIEPVTTNLQGSSQGGQVTYTQYTRMEFAKKIIDVFEADTYNQYVYINPAYAHVDLDNAFDTTTVVLDDRLPSVEDLQVTDATHCNEAGMFQIGDSYYPMLQHILQV